MTNRGALVLMSGGIDSAACAHFLQARNYAVRGVFFDFGQSASIFEARAVKALASQLGVPLTAHAMTAATAFPSGELIGRNAFLIFSALFFSRWRSGLLALGIHAGTPYYDCSPAFLETMTRLVAEHTDGAVQLVAPFLNWTKADVFNYFVSSGLPLQITYSCEAGGEPSCGNCASCRDRRALGC